MFKRNFEYKKISTDMHTHILPEIDDGSKSALMSVEMLKAEAAQGITSVMLTPHFYAWENSPESFIKKRDHKFRKLSEEIRRSDLTLPKLALGAEVMYFEGIGSCEALKKLAIPGSNYLLLEMPFVQWSHRTLEEVKKIGAFLKLIPIIAHLDRYLDIQSPKTVSELLDMNVLVQVNAEFFLNRRSRKRALGFVDDGMIHFIGSDCHNLEHRPPNIEKASEIIYKKLGGDTVDRINHRTNSLLKDIEFI